MARLKLVEIGTKKATRSRGNPRTPKGDLEVVPSEEGLVDDGDPNAASEGQAEALEGRLNDDEPTPTPGSFEALFEKLPKTYPEMKPEDFELKMPPIYELLADNKCNHEYQQLMIDRLLKWGLKSRVINTRLKQVLEARSEAERAVLEARSEAERAVARAAEEEAQRIAAEDEEALRALDDRTPPVGFEWMEDLDRSPKTGALIGNLKNATMILEKDPAWMGVLARNKFAERYVFRKPPPFATEDEFTAGMQLRDSDNTRILTWIQQQERYKGFSLSLNSMYSVVYRVGGDHSYDPWLDYLRQLTWDGLARVDNFLGAYLGCDDDDYHREVSKEFWLSHVARGLRPGCKVDTMMILQGGQGMEKSLLIESLCPDPNWFLDDLGPIESKDSKQQLSGRSLVEISEMASLSRSDEEARKKFLTTKVDRYRPPYGRVTEDIARHCVFVGTANPNQILRDPTGNRRYHPVRVGHIDIEAVRRDRDQLLAEAVYRVNAGEHWWLTRGVDDELIREFETRQEASRMPQPREDKIEEYLDSVIDSYPGGKAWVQVDNIAAHLGFTPDKMHQGISNEIASALQHFGWVRVQRRLGPLQKDGTRKRLWIYVPPGSTLEPDETQRKVRVEEPGIHLDAPDSDDSIAFDLGRAPSQESGELSPVDQATKHDHCDADDPIPRGLVGALAVTTTETKTDAKDALSPLSPPSPGGDIKVRGSDPDSSLPAASTTMSEPYTSSFVQSASSLNILTSGDSGDSGDSKGNGGSSSVTSGVKATGDSGDGQESRATVPAYATMVALDKGIYRVSVRLITSEDYRIGNTHTHVISPTQRDRLALAKVYGFPPSLSEGLSACLDQHRQLRADVTRHGNGQVRFNSVRLATPDELDE